MIADKRIYRVQVTEDVRLTKDIYVSAYTKDDAWEYVNSLVEDGDERVECTMDDFDEVSYRDVYVFDDVLDQHVRADFDTGIISPEQ